MYATTLLLFRPQSQVRVNLDAIRLQRQVLGPLTHEDEALFRLLALLPSVPIWQLMGLM